MPLRTDDDVAVSCTDLSLSRAGVRVLDGVSFTLRPGAALAVMGPTGAGKSTLADLLAAVDDSDIAVAGGDVHVLGVPIRTHGRRRRLRVAATGHLPQGAGAALPSRLTVAEVIGEPITSRDRRVSPRALAVRVASLLDELQLPLGAADRYPYELSAGMRQRVALARAVVLEPRLFVGDEPYANLDPDVRTVARDALLRRRDEAGMALLVVSNDAPAIEELDADVLVLRGGRPVAFGHGTRGLRWTPGERARVVS